METNRSRQISDLLAKTRAALENARDGNWEQVISDEQQRRRMITELFSEPMDARDAQCYRDVIEEILQLNKKLEQIAAEARDRARLDADSISKGRRAVDVYSENIC